MPQVFIELYNYKPAWRELAQEKRLAYATAVANAVKELTTKGVEVLGYGTNSNPTANRAPYDFFCVYRVPSADFQRKFEIQVQASGWYDLFEQVNVSGETTDFTAALLAHAKL